MSLPENSKFSLSPAGARNLSHPTITVPMMETMTPRWMLNLLPWVPLEAGVYRVNRIKKNSFSDDNNMKFENIPDTIPGNLGENPMPESYADYETDPREYTLNAIQTILRMNTQVTDIFNSPINQQKEQTRITIEAMKEQQEYEMINNNEFGLINSVSPNMKVQSRAGTPTPDDMDELLSRVWKKPAFFLAHPKAIAAFGRECTRRGVPPMTVNIQGCPFITWRGVPLIPSDKMLIDENQSTNILLMRVGEREQGVVGIHQTGIPGETNIPGLSIHFGGINNRGISSYIMTLYFGIVVLTGDALGMLENVNVGRYHEYQ